MEPIVLTDKSVKPNDDIIFGIIGEKILLWQEIIKYLNNHYKDISEQWNYYNDGKSWLYRTLKKKKTIFWIGVQKDTFRISFWFGEKAGSLILQSDLPENVKKDYINARRFKIGRAIT